MSEKSDNKKMSNKYKMKETRQEALGRIAKDIKLHEHTIYNLEMLIFIKKGYIYKF